MKQFSLVVTLFVSLALAFSSVQAQNTKHDIIPLPVGTTSLLADPTTYTGHSYLSSETKSTAILDMLNYDSLNLLLVLNDTASIASIKAVHMHSPTATFGDTSATLGAFTSVAETGGAQVAKRFHYITNVMAANGTIGRYIRFVIAYNASGNHVASSPTYTSKTEIYAKRYQKRRDSN